MSAETSLSRRTFLKVRAASPPRSPCQAGSCCPRTAARSSPRDTPARRTTASPSPSRGPQQFKATLAAGRLHQEHGDRHQPDLVQHPSGSWVSIFELLSTRIAGGLPLDSAYIATEGMLLFEEQNLLDPLDSYHRRRQGDHDGLLQGRHPAHANGLPDPRRHPRSHLLRTIGYNVMSIWYNRALFKQYNVPEPAPGWTWDDSPPRPPRSPPPRTGRASPSVPPCPARSRTCTRGYSPTVGYILNPAKQRPSPGARRASRRRRSSATWSARSSPTNRVVRTTPRRRLCGALGHGRRGHVAQPWFWRPPGGGQQDFCYRAVAGVDSGGYARRRRRVPDVQLLQKQGGHVGVHQVQLLRRVPARARRALRWGHADQVSVGTDPSFLSQWPQGTDYFTKGSPTRP